MNPPPAIICIGRNYADHALEMGSTPPIAPTVFMKNPAAIIGDGDSIVIPAACETDGPEVDFEGELAVILGQDIRDASPDTVMSSVHGYAAANDVSARWWQKKGSGGQWIRGKSFDTFCPIGPVIPATSVPDPQALRLLTRVNNEVMQEASTSEMIFTIQELLVDLSRGMTLLAGTVLLTGTPAGVGAGRTPQRFLGDGDVVEVEIEGVGRVANPVRHETPGVTPRAT